MIKYSIDLKQLKQRTSSWLAQLPNKYPILKRPDRYTYFLDPDKEWPLNTKQNVPFGQMWARATGSPTHFQQFRQDIRSRLPEYAKLFTEASLYNFIDRFNPHETVSVYHMYPAQFRRPEPVRVKYKSSTGQHIRLPHPNRLSYEQVLRRRALDSLLQHPHKTLLTTQNTTSNSPAVSKYISEVKSDSAQQQQKEGHELRHYTMHDSGSYEDIFGRKWYQPTARYVMQLIKDKDRYSKTGPGSQPHAVVPNGKDTYISELVQRAQAQMAINHSRNLLANTLRRYPTSYPYLSKEQKEYILSRPTFWKTKQQAKQFFNRLKNDPALLRAMPLQGKRGLGNRWNVQKNRYKDPKLYDWYDDAWLLTNNTRNQAAKSPA